MNTAPREVDSELRRAWMEFAIARYRVQLRQGRDMPSYQRDQTMPALLKRQAF